MPKTIANPILERAQQFGLRPDKGWLDELCKEVAAMPAERQELWVALLGLLAKPISPYVELVLPTYGPVKYTWVDRQGCFDVFSDEPGYEDMYGPAPQLGTDGMKERLLSMGPTEAWMSEVLQLIGQIGEEEFSRRLAEIYHLATQSKWVTKDGPNRDALWGMMWLAPKVKVNASLLIQRLHRLATWAIDKNSVQFTTAAIVLAQIENEESAATLRLIEQEAKKPYTKHRFAHMARHLETILGLSADQTTEKFVTTCGFAAGGVRRHELGSAAAELRIAGNKVQTKWINEKGKEVAAPSAAMTRDHAAVVNEVKAAAKDAQKVLASQRDRLDRLMALPRSWKFAEWRPYYLDHPLVGLLARRLIWIIDDVPVLFDQAGNAKNIWGDRVEAQADSQVALWHPALRGVAEVQAWRLRIEELGITQPFKQAHREVYLLTEAERVTRTYSNRFAAHVIRQHQFKSLCLARSWKYSLQLVYNEGRGEPASRKLSGFNIRAEFWADPVGEVRAHGEHTSEPGAYLHLTSDQVRFYEGDSREPMALERVPVLAFSEIMRDVDLFVGVCSVGNDPTWRDGGPEGRFVDYWQHFSFGELAESAKTRKAVLERLIPRLKIASLCSISERFLVVRGELRTYKIHLGSSNILMEPNDQYLCIVPDRSMRSAEADVLLPFEGDSTLSVIISKAFLLAEDKKITDETIVRQINRVLTS